MLFMDLLVKQKEKIDLQIDLSNKVNDKINKTHREALLREQLKAIQDELDEGKDSKKNKKEYRDLIAEAGMPSDVEEIALEQVDKLESSGQQNFETSIIQNYLDLLVALPWKTGELKEIDINKAREILGFRTLRFKGGKREDYTTPGCNKNEEKQERIHSSIGRPSGYR